MGSAPGPPMMAPFEASGVKGDRAGCQVMLCPNIASFCACMGTLQQQSSKDSSSRESERRKKFTAGPSGDRAAWGRGAFRDYYGWILCRSVHKKNLGARFCVELKEAIQKYCDDAMV